MSTQPTRIMAALVSALFLIGAVLPVRAQARFEVLGQDSIAEVSGLRIVTIRDSQLSACYTLFIVEPPAAAPETVVSEPVTTNDATRQSVQRIREAGEKRDRQLEALKTESDAEYERHRKTVDDEYERVLRTEIPGSYPYVVPAPGMRTGGWEDAANAMRRAMLDPDPASTMKTMASQLARLDDQLKRLAEAPRLAASGPVACPAGRAEAAKPPR